MGERWIMPGILELDDGRLPAAWRSRPRGFAALMSLYESNHLRLTQLAGDLHDLEGGRRSCVEGDCELALGVTERSAYTTTVELTYLFGALPSAPDMLLRIYHDARLVEAHGWAQRHEHPALRDGRAEAGPALDQRWARNVMLNKWLEYCLE
ncbi:MAG: DUF1249 domain-containing protein, partial [Gammaproteobacteria bacterium]